MKNEHLFRKGHNIWTKTLEEQDMEDSDGLLESA